MNRLGFALGIVAAAGAGIALAFALEGCKGQILPPVGPSPDSGDGSPALLEAGPSASCQQACANELRLGCIEGAADNCAEVLTRMEAGLPHVRGTSGLFMTCFVVAAASSPAAVNATGATCTTTGTGSLPRPVVPLMVPIK